jgi:hypothetical protein
MGLEIEKKRVLVRERERESERWNARKSAKGRAL